MLNEIISKYEKFSDSLISEIKYVSNERKAVEVTINCMNRFEDYKFETIKLLFEDVLSIRFVENENNSSTLVNSALISSQNEFIVFDFFPLIFGEDELKENRDSDLQIKCKRVSYKKIP